MSQPQQQQLQSNIPVSEVYWSLVAKADKKFSKIRDLPYYERNRYDTYFYKVFKAYTQLWKFQQENRQKLVESGLKRWEIGDIASRIGQLYFGQYMRTSEANYLSESYIFYEAVLNREYFNEGLFQDLNLTNKQLRFLARFLTVCLVLNRREMVHQLVNQLKRLTDECKRTFQETDFREWKVVIQEIVKFLKADTAFLNIRPLRYSTVLDLHPDYLPYVVNAKRKLRLRDALLCSYHPNEIKFSELTLDTFRMLQCLEWEPSGSFYQANAAHSGGAGTTIQDGGVGSSRVYCSHEITDPTLPANPRKAILYRPSVTHFIAVLATICEELPPDGVLLIYISASGSSLHTMTSPTWAGTFGNTENISKSFPYNTMCSETTHASSFCSPHDIQNHSSEPSKEDSLSHDTVGLHIGARGNGGLSFIYPSDLIPFTRRPLFLVLDSDSSKSFKAMNRTNKGEPVAMLLSPCTLAPLPESADSSRHSVGSIFTCFLTAPLQAFLLILGFSGSDIEMDTYGKAEKLLLSSLNHLGLTLAAADTLHPVWAQVLCDPFLRRLLLRYIFCQTVLTLYAPTSNKEEYLPECMPPLPEAVRPSTAASQTAVLQIATIFGAADRFIFSEGILPSENIDTGEESITPS